MTEPRRRPLAIAEDQRADILAFALPGIVGEWDAGNIDNVGVAKAILAIVDRAGVHLGDEGLRAALERLPRVRLTGEQLDRLDPDPEKHAWVDWDEYEEFVSLADVRAALAAQENPEAPDD